MAEQIKDGGLAFPSHEAGPSDPRAQISGGGISVRDYYMAHAPAAPAGFMKKYMDFNSFANWADAEAAWRLSYGRAMLKAREAA